MEDSDETITSDVGAQFLCWGCGEFGQHCHETSCDVSFCDGKVDTLSPADVRHQVRLAGSGSSHNIVVTNSNEIFVWGNGNSGQLGCSEEETLLEPTQIVLPSTDSASSVKGVSCGGRHTMLWLENGRVYCFGNNFYAQLGYDFQEKNYKENKYCPTLLSFLIYRPVMQVACGDKHTVFLFFDGTLAAMGNNAHGQIGVGTNQEAVVPNFNLVVDKPVKAIACGANHNLAISDDGDVYVWGYSKGCGHKRHDVLSPELFMAGHNVVQVSGGSAHSMALTENGSVYSWGSGVDGELGHGQSLMFLYRPRRLKDSDIQGCVVQIACGESFSAAVTVSGKLFMWGKNSHTIEANQKSSYRISYPRCMNETGGPKIKTIFCGAWHAAAITGPPDWKPAGCESDSDLGEEEEDVLSMASKMMAADNIGDLQIKEDRLIENGFGDCADLKNPVSSPTQETAGLDRSTTKLTLEEFYAPSPSPVRKTKSHTSSMKTGSVYDGHRSTTSFKSQSSAGSRSRLVVQLPASVPDSDSSSQSSRSAQKLNIRENSEDVFSKYARDPSARKSHSAHSKTPVQTSSKIYKKESTKRSKTLMAGKMPRHTVQVSNRMASNYSLPRENTVLANKNFNFVNAEDLLTTPPVHVGHGTEAGSVVGSQNPFIEKEKEHLEAMLKHPQLNGMRSLAHAGVSKHYSLQRSRTTLVRAGNLHRDNTRVFNKLVTSGQPHTKMQRSPFFPDPQKHQDLNPRTDPHSVIDFGEVAHSFGYPSHGKSNTFNQRGSSNVPWADGTVLNFSQKEQNVFVPYQKRIKRPVFSSASSWRNTRDLESFSITSNPESASSIRSCTLNKIVDENRSLRSGTPASGSTNCSNVHGHVQYPERSLSSKVNANAANQSANKRGLIRNPHKMLGTAMIHPRTKQFSDQHRKNTSVEKSID